ncbi:2-amino-4-hydroxy-6-hydroxymethyldihydropteridine diphosphokinase [uncultured Shewanella sp.]|uniref:2-amino-4-hydroxy-6- hydroxymethyldihydropteridine diphosphokinase n=1 Tax=Shewanella atlantica TaxID=271099 RepID=UPI0026382AE7|nr:2-amino-4-hydroxy-6-hydroxymethyldihydropteridine diphosphokinase [uncultured Shewanella sp.]
MYYYLSIGTNIAPELNAVRITSALCQRFGVVIGFPFIYTEPIGIESEHRFLNSLAVVESAKGPDEVKLVTNLIETSLGRDREASDCSLVDRVADIDIVTYSEILDFSLFLSSRESYVSSLLTVEPSRYVDLSQYGLPSTDGPTAINFNAGSGNIVVIEQEGYGLKNRHVSALKR